MKPTLINPFRALRYDQRGTAVIETALVLPVLVLLFAGLIDFSLGFAVKLRTQQAASRAVEYASQAGLDATENLSVIKSEAATGARVPQQQVVTRLWLECAGIEQPLYDGTCTTGQETARYLSVNIYNFYRPAFAPLVSPHSQVMNMSGRSTVRLQ